jgi:catechol 2,3-dioxygenase-like lactoylglutathione lyase family enzyme
MHAILFSSGAEKNRAFFRDVLGLPSVDAGDGWMIFGLPPAELAFHPTEGESFQEFYLICDDIETTVRDWTSRGAEFTGPVTDRSWGLFTAVRLPGGGELGVYQPKHPRPGMAEDSGKTP